MLELFRTITGHARFSRNTSGDEDNLTSGQTFSETGRSRVVALDGALCVDVAEISSNTCFSIVCYYVSSPTPTTDQRTWTQSDIVEG